MPPASATTLKVAIIGLNRTSTSVGLALRRFEKKSTKYDFQIIGYGLTDTSMKEAEKINAVDKIERNAAKAVEGADIVILATSYDETESIYRTIAPGLRAGAVVLDFSILKQPSIEWASEYFGEDQHLVGMTPVVNPTHLYNPVDTVEQAEEDLFDNSATLVVPAPGSPKQAVDLAFNFAAIIGSKPRFLDPLEHDTLFARTDQLPNLLGVTLFYYMMQQNNWDDLRWLTNPAFGSMTRVLFDRHPDALRDEWFNNREALSRMLDGFIGILNQLQVVIRDGDKDALESVAVDSSKAYEDWINSRYRADWDSAAAPPDVKPQSGILQGLLGENMANRLTGNKDDK